MAKKRTIIEEQIPDSAATGVDESAWIGDEEVIIDKIKEQFGGTIVKCKIYKIIPGKSQPVYCFESEESVSESEIQERHNGGKYAIRYLVDGVVKHTQYIEVADRPAAPVSSNPADIQVQMLREQSQFNRELLMAVLSGKNGGGGTSTPMNEIAAMWSLIHGTPSGGGGGVDKMIELFTKGMEIGAGKSGDMDWKTAAIQVVKEIAPSITSIAAGMKGIPMQPNPQAQQQIPSEAVLKTGIDFIKSKILGGLPVGLALDWIVANANDYQQFLSLVLPKSFEEIVQVDPELANEPYNSWTRQFLEGLKLHFKDASVVDAEDEQE